MFFVASMFKNKNKKFHSEENPQLGTSDIYLQFKQKSYKITSNVGIVMQNMQKITEPSSN